MPFLNTIKSSMGDSVAGRRASMEEWNTVTRFAEDTVTNPIKFGQPVQYGSEDGKIKKLSVTDEGQGVFFGITEADIALESDSYPEGYSVPVMKTGVIWVVASGECTAGQSVAWSPETGKYNNQGNLLLENAVFDSSAKSDGELVKVRLNGA